MAEILTLTVPETKPTITTWRVRLFSIDADAPSVTVEFIADTGEVKTWRYVAVGTVTLAQVKAAVSFINQGKFATVQAKSLEKWLVEQGQAAGILGPGAVSGVPN